jgi:hypothetical protein
LVHVAVVPLPLLLIGKQKDYHPGFFSRVESSWLPQQNVFSQDRHHHFHFITLGGVFLSLLSWKSVTGFGATSGAQHLPSEISVAHGTSQLSHLWMCSETKKRDYKKRRIMFCWKSSNCLVEQPRLKRKLLTSF